MSEKKIDAQLKRELQAAKADVPDWIHLRMERTLSGLRIKRKFRRILGYGAAAVFLTIGGLGGASWMNPVLAETFRNIPIVNSIFQYAGDLATRRASEEGQTAKVNVSAEYKGIRMTIKEVLYDGGRLSFGYSMEADSRLIPVRPTLFVNGVEMQYRPLDARNETMEDGGKIGVVDLLPEKPFPDSFKLAVKYDTMLEGTGRDGEALKLVKGSWAFELPMTKTKTGTKQFEIKGAMARDGDKVLTVNHVTAASDETVIDFDTWGIEPGVRLTGQPDAPDSVSSMSWDRFQVLDDRGVPLQIFGAGSGTDGADITKVKRRLALAPLGRIPEYLVIRPYDGLFEFPYRDARIAKEKREAGKLPVTLSQGKAGSVTVVLAEFAKRKTTVYYYVNGENPFVQAWEVWLESTAGGVTRGSPVLVDRDTLLFAMDFPPMDDSKEFYFAARELHVPGVNKALEVKVPLQTIAEKKR
jgi:hypothetical protein